jgi:Protein of unknown function (DUF3159)
MADPVTPPWGTSGGAGRPGTRGDDGTGPQEPASFRAGLAQAVQDQFSFEKAFGGVRGVLEAVLPVTVFSVVYGITRDVTPSAVAALAPAAVLAVWRLVAREPLTQAVGGLVGVGIGAFIAVRTGQAETFFLPSIIKNAAYAAAYLVSILVRWPLIGVILGVVLGEGTHWRRVPPRMRAYVIASWLWVGLFGVRLLVQVPLYLADRVALLGAVNVGLGLPLFGLVVWGSWLVLRRVPVAYPPGHEPHRHFPRPHLPHPHGHEGAHDAHRGGPARDGAPDDERDDDAERAVRPGPG